MNTLRLCFWAFALFVATLVLHTRHNTFPFYYHPDEPGKVEQVLGMRPWNFHHPMLLLSTTKLIASSARTEQTVVETGRWVSAAFTAGAVVALSLLGYMWRGWVVAILAGLTLMLHHQLFELSHYMKEDTSLLFGITVAFLGAYIFLQRPGTAAAMLLGAGCGLAISGKYLGVITLVIAVPVLCRRSVKGQPWLTAFVTMLLVFVAVNLPLLRDLNTFTSSFSRETRLVVEGQGEMTQSVPHSRYWSIFLTNTTPVIWVLLLVVMRAAFMRRRDWSMIHWIILLFPFVFAIALSFSPKDNDRYFLPATALFTLLAAVGVGEIARHFGGRERMVEIIVGSLLILAQLPSWTSDRGGLIKYWQAFQRDDTGELTAWLRDNTKPTDILAKDKKVRLPNIERHGVGPSASPLPNPILEEDYAADIGSIPELRAKGVTHVLITESTYKKFERAGLKPKQGEVTKYESRKLFYATLRRDFDPVRVWPRSTVIYLHPGLEVYRIAP